MWQRQIRMTLYIRTLDKRELEWIRKLVGELLTFVSESTHLTMDTDDEEITPVIADVAPVTLPRLPCTSLSSLESSTRFTRSELRLLYRGFKQVTRLNFYLSDGWGQSINFITFFSLLPRSVHQATSRKRLSSPFILPFSQIQSHLNTRHLFSPPVQMVTLTWHLTSSSKYFPV